MGYEVLDGKSLGYTKNELFIIDHDRHTERVLAIKGRWYYVKKCVRKETIGDSTILMCDKSRRDCTISFVMGVGDECGKYHKLMKMEKDLPDMQSQMSFVLNVYDTIVTPDDHVYGIKRSPYNADEYFVHECVISSIIERGNDE